MPGHDQIAHLTVSSLFGEPNTVSRTAGAIMESIEGATLEEKEVKAITKVFPKKLSYFYCIQMVEGLWGNGGMQQVVLAGRGLDWCEALLGTCAEAYAYYGDTVRAAVVSELRANAPRWNERLEELDRQEAPDSEFATVWKEIDAYDARFDIGDLSCHERLLQDLHEHPGDFLHSREGA